MAKYFSQYKQDRFLDKVVFNAKKQGFFVEIGAHDGISFSNSYFFERYRDWKGVCIEPNPNVFSKLVKNRTSLNLNLCIGDDDKMIDFTKIEGYAEMLSGIKDSYAPEHLRRIEKEVATHGGKVETISVKMKSLNDIEAVQNQKIDFISIDTEGNEFDILQSIDFNTLDISCFLIENNYSDPRIEELMLDNRYITIAKLGKDEVYYKKIDLNPALNFRLWLWRNLLRLKKSVSKLLKKKK